MKNKLLLFAIFIATATQVFAEHVTPEKAAQVAKNFIIQKIDVTNQTNTSKTIGLNLVADDRNSENQHFYMFNLNDEQGWVIVSDDDLFIPILGYSTEGNIRIDNIPVNMKEWLDGYNREIQFGLDNKVAADEQITTQWKELFDGTSVEFIDRSGSGVAPLITTQWGQGDPYNQLCPYDYIYQKRTPTGCVATAMAQIMNYWQYPEVGTGSHSYIITLNYGTQSANFGNTYYDWDNMPDRLSSTSSSAEIDAVATLMYHCGVSVNMDYGVNGSGASVIGGSNTAEYALRTYFGYKSTLKGQYKKNFSNDEWVNKLKSDLYSGRPIVYRGSKSAGGGHCFVCDGCDSNDKFHFNWGWNGSYDGYFSLTALNPGTYSFTYDQRAIFGIEPSYNLTIGDGNSTSYSPFNNFYRNSWNECIYPKESFESACMINSISYDCAANSTYTCTSLKIYMGERSSSKHSSNNDWTSLNDLELVYSGTNVVIGANNGWQDFILDTPFEYTKAGNLVVVVAKTAPTYTSNLVWKSSTISNRCLYRQNNNNVTYAQHPNNYAGSRSSYRPNIRLHTQPLSVIGNETNSSNLSPFNNYFRYSWTECLYDDKEINNKGIITSISFDCATSSAYTIDEKFEIYIGERTPETYGTGISWCLDFELVYSRSNVTIGGNQGWQEFILDKPYNYSSNNNLVIIIAKSASSWSSSSLKWSYTSRENTCIYKRSDSDNSCSNRPTIIQFGKRTDKRANVKLKFVKNSSKSDSEPEVSEIILGDETSPEIEYVTLEEVVTDEGIRIFPNPAQNVINIEMEDNNFEYVIYNELGQVVRQGKSCGKSQINVEDCQKGLYLIKIATEEKTSTHKIVIE